MIVKSASSNIFGSDFLQIAAILSSSIATCIAGILFSWPSPSIPILVSEDFPGEITIEQASYLPVIPPIASICASLIWPLIMEKIGRKKTVLLVALPYTAVFLIVIFCDSLEMLYLSRFIDGIGDACVFTVLPTYIGEIATPRVRGLWGNAITVAICLGITLINGIGGVLDIKTTACILISLPVLFVGTFVFMPESPYYLISEKRDEEAKNCLRRLRGRVDVEEELQQIKKDVARQMGESGTWTELFTNPTHRFALISGAFARGAQQFSGIAAFNVYTHYLFQEAGGEISSTTSGVIYGGFLTFMQVIGSYFLDKLGRRKAMLLSCGGASMALAAEAVYFYLKDEVHLDVSSVSWFPVAGIVAYVLIYSIGISIVPTLILSELFSASVKAKGLCILNVIFSLYVSGVTKLFQFLASNYGLYTPFLMFCLCCITSTFLSLFLVPETRGKTLEEIQQSLKK